MRQVKRFESEQDIDKAIQVAHNIGYLIGIQKDLIRDDTKLEDRILKLEELAGVTKKGVITR